MSVKIQKQMLMAGERTLPPLKMFFNFMDNDNSKSIPITNSQKVYRCVNFLYALSSVDSSLYQYFLRNWQYDAQSGYGELLSLCKSPEEYSLFHLHIQAAARRRTYTQLTERVQELVDGKLTLKGFLFK